MVNQSEIFKSDAERGVRAFIDDSAFPCVGAKSALHKDRLRFVQLGPLGDGDEARPLGDALDAYAREFAQPGVTPVSLIALFEPTAMDEPQFERKLWDQLNALHALDLERGQGWDPTVSDDPERNDFSFSYGGQAFFVVGLHPGASRIARRAPVPCLVFNFHAQFEELKRTGKYQSMQAAVRARDIKLQGSINPVLARFGEASEARQYSGRAVEAAWKCPFHRQQGS